MTADTAQSFRAACVQMCAGRDPSRNLATALALIAEAADGGAAYVQTPEMTTLMELDRATLFAKIYPEHDDPALLAFCDLAKKRGIWLHIGSLPIKIGEAQAVNRAFVISPTGQIAARYDKMHMFDVDLPNGESYRESRTYQPGSDGIVVDLPWARIGVTICYDVRFAYLYRALAHAGATILTVPAAFTEKTGKAHWHLLLRARAVETGCFVIAAAQGGMHENGRATFGHSLIIGPWGDIIAEYKGNEPGVLFGEVNLDEVTIARGRVPSLMHDRTVSGLEHP